MGIITKEKLQKFIAEYKPKLGRRILGWTPFSDDSNEMQALKGFVKLLKPGELIPANLAKLKNLINKPKDAETRVVFEKISKEIQKNEEAIELARKRKQELLELERKREEKIKGLKDSIPKVFSLPLDLWTNSHFLQFSQSFFAMLVEQGLKPEFITPEKQLFLEHAAAVLYLAFSFKGYGGLDTEFGAIFTGILSQSLGQAIVSSDPKNLTLIQELLSWFVGLGIQTGFGLLTGTGLLFPAVRAANYVGGTIFQRVISALFDGFKTHFCPDHSKKYKHTYAFAGELLKLVAFGIGGRLGESTLAFVTPVSPPVTTSSKMPKAPASPATGTSPTVTASPPTKATPTPAIVQARSSSVANILQQPLGEAVTYGSEEARKNCKIPEGSLFDQIEGSLIAQRSCHATINFHDSPEVGEVCISDVACFTEAVNEKIKTSFWIHRIANGCWNFVESCSGWLFVNNGYAGRACTSHSATQAKAAELVAVAKVPPRCEISQAGGIPSTCTVLRELTTHLKDPKLPAIPSCEVILSCEVPRNTPFEVPKKVETRTVLQNFWKGCTHFWENCGGWPVLVFPWEVGKCQGKDLATIGEYAKESIAKLYHGPR